MMRRFGWLLLVFAALLPAARAQQGHLQNPITNGTDVTAMDAPLTSRDLERYTHSPTVQSIAKRLGITTVQAARYFEDFNSGVLLLVVGYYLLKLVPGKLRAKRAGVDRELREARAATADAQRRLQAVQARMDALGGEIEALRRQAAEGLEAEHVRMQAALTVEKSRIVHQAEAEIAAAQANAERGLRRFVAELALERAVSRISLSPEGDREIVDAFLRDLAPQLQGRN